MRRKGPSAMLVPGASGLENEGAGTSDATHLLCVKPHQSGGPQFTCTSDQLGAHLELPLLSV